jgi:uncharacterized protein YbjT (DUF2867 family)
MNKLIVVVGATGHQGSSVVKYLQQKGGWKIRGICRNTSSQKAKELSDQGVEMVSCDLSNKYTVNQALSNAYGVFGVTTPIWGNTDHEMEYVQGRNLVDAAVSNNIQHFVFSSLDDVTKATNGKIDVPHFTNKNRVEQDARKSSIPNCTFVYPPFYYENIPGMMFRLNEDKSGATIFSGVNTDRRLPMFSVDDIGIVVSEVFNNPDQYNRQKLLAAGDNITFPEMADICSRVLNIPTTYVAMDENTVAQQMGNELCNMFKYYNEYGFYHDGEEEALKQARKLFPQMTTFEQYVQQNKQRFLGSQK